MRMQKPITIDDVISILEEMDMLEVGAEGGPPTNWGGGPTNWSEPTSEYPVAQKRLGEPRLPNRDEDLEFLPGDEWREVLDDLESGAGGEEHTPGDGIIDVLAWYQPIHYHGYGWGIYIYESAIVDIAKSIISYLPSSRRCQFDAQVGALRSAFQTLFLHEVFHHKVESFAIMLEVIGRKSHYVPYHELVYQPLFGTDDLIEEGLACAEQKKRLLEQTYKKHVPDDVLDAAQRMLGDWIPRLLPGYRTGSDFLEEWEYERAIDRLSAQIQETSTVPTRNPNELKLARRAYHGLLGKQHEGCMKNTRMVVPVGSTPRIPWF